MIKHSRKDTFTINAADFQHISNKYDSNKPHPYNTEIVLINHDQSVVEMTLGNLMALMNLFDAMRAGGSPGPALDKLYVALRNAHGEEALSKSIKI